MDRRDGWVSLMSRRLQARDPALKVINASISGETSRGGLARLPALLLDHQPELVVIELGANDGLRGTPLRIVESNLDRLVSDSKEAGADVVLLGMRLPPNYGYRYADSFYRMFGRVAERHQIAYHPFFLEGVGGDPELMQTDGLHPNRRAQSRLLENIWPLVEKQLTR
jgi:acyl-CoA thioesterase-1